MSLSDIIKKNGILGLLKLENFQNFAGDKSEYLSRICHEFDIPKQISSTQMVDSIKKMMILNQLGFPFKELQKFKRGELNFVNRKDQFISEEPIIIYNQVFNNIDIMLKVSKQKETSFKEKPTKKVKFMDLTSEDYNNEYDENDFNEIENDCTQQYGFSWEDNSCYLDSVLYAFLFGTHIYENYFKNQEFINLKYSTSWMNTLRKELFDELKSLYDKKLEKNQSCKSIRLIIKKHIKNIKEINKKGIYDFLEKLSKTNYASTVEVLKLLQFVYVKNENLSFYMKTPFVKKDNNHEIENIQDFQKEFPKSDPKHKTYRIILQDGSYMWNTWTLNHSPIYFKIETDITLQNVNQGSVISLYDYMENHFNQTFNEYEIVFPENHKSKGQVFRIYNESLLRIREKRKNWNPKFLIVFNNSPYSNLTKWSIKFEDLNNYKLKLKAIVSLVLTPAEHYITYFECNNKWYGYDGMKSGIRILRDQDDSKTSIENLNHLIENNILKIKNFECLFYEEK